MKRLVFSAIVAFFLTMNSVNATITIGTNVHFTINGVDRTFTQTRTFETVYRDSEGVWWFDDQTFSEVENEGFASGKYNIVISVSANYVPVLGAIVRINEENKTTNFFGQTTWQLSFGDYLIYAYYQGKNQTQAVSINQDRTIGFNFQPEIPSLPSGPNALLIIAVALIGSFIFLTFIKRKR